MSRYSPPGELGTTMGVAQTFAGLARVTAPILATTAFQRLGHGWPFYLAGVFVALVGIMAFQVEVRPRVARSAAEQAEAWVDGRRWARATGSSGGPRPGGVLAGGRGKAGRRRSRRKCKIRGSTCSQFHSSSGSGCRHVRLASSPPPRVPAGLPVSPVVCFVAIVGTVHWPARPSRGWSHRAHPGSGIPAPPLLRSRLDLAADAVRRRSHCRRHRGRGGLAPALSAIAPMVPR